MRSRPNRLVAEALLVALGAGLVAGCVSHREPATETLCEQQFRDLHPRKYVDSLDPWERREAEHRMQDEDRQDGKRHR